MGGQLNASHTWLQEELTLPPALIWRFLLQAGVNVEFDLEPWVWTQAGNNRWAVILTTFTFTSGNGQASDPQFFQFRS